MCKNGKNIIERLEYKLNIPDRQFTNFLFDNFFKHVPNGFFIEAGANTGYEGSVCWHLEHDYGWTGMNIECNSHCFLQLVKTRPGCINVNKALSDREKDMVFTFPTDGPRKLFAGQGSVIFKPNHWNGRPTKQVKVKSTTLRKLLGSYDIKSVDLLVLDVEGCELEALAGLNGSEVMPSVFCIEDDKINLIDLSNIMTNWGYKKFNKRYKNNTVYYYDNTR